MFKKKIYFFIGTTSELIKIAAIFKELKNRQIPFKIISAGQTKVHFEDLVDLTGIKKADILLKEKTNKSSVIHFIVWTFATLLTAPFVLKKQFKGLNSKNAYFVIYGDPVASVIGGIIAKLFHLKLVHIESGDLSFNLLEPFPEEICRNINIRLADILFAPTDWAKNNLKNLRAKKISTKQNTIMETTFWALKTGKLPAFARRMKKYYVLILHRQEHVIFRKDWSRKMLELIITNANQEVNCLIPKHPQTVKIINALKPSLPKKISKRIILIPWLSYREFIKLIEHAEFIATDGASNQQEVFYLGKPCLALRDYTEQIEGLGENVLLAKSNTNTIKDFLKNYKKYQRPKVKIKNSQRPSKIVVDYLLKH